jgi:hypothetical protein
MRRRIALLSLLVLSSACTPHGNIPRTDAKTSTQESSGRPDAYKHPSTRMGFSDMPQRMPIMREKYYGPEGGCTVGRQTKGWC